jgi:nucleotide-binding universal stress UspA family protein
VIGIAACQSIEIIYSAEIYRRDIIRQHREEVEREIQVAEAEFRSALQTRVNNLEWRSAVTKALPSDYLAHEARSADLIVTGVDRNAPVSDIMQQVDIRNLVMKVGRPILIVPAATASLKLDHVIVGWQDTREARRTVADALPFLKEAGHVMVVEIADEEDMAAALMRVSDVVSWLLRHGVVAEFLAVKSTGNDATQLKTIAQEQAADLIVAGAYGHSRLSEWVFGGVTRDLLLPANICSLVSH